MTIVTDNSDKQGGPYTIHEFNGTFIPVSHRGPVINAEWVSHSEEGCVRNLIAAYGVDNISVKTFRIPSEAALFISDILKKRGT